MSRWQAVITNTFSRSGLSIFYKDSRYLLGPHDDDDDDDDDGDDDDDDDGNDNVSGSFTNILSCFAFRRMMLERLNVR